ncbi:hypothetical protein OHS81_02060 [Streptomyces sp. NBC_00400]|uniref:hypothetical protein n=1 Tax=Streptomyces sp. NBC_00400 TaxID=2975737 RepID=UPI002E24148A
MTFSLEWEHRLGAVQLVRVADGAEAGDPSVVDLERDQPVELATGDEPCRGHAVAMA